MADQQEIPVTNVSGDTPVSVEMHLTDDKADKGSEFRGATLELNTNSVNPSSVPDPDTDVEFRGPNIRRDRPFSASTVSRNTTASTKSKTSLSPYIQQNDFTVKHFFSYRNGVFENAVESCQKYLKEDLDGQITGAWLLTDIDHWDNEREKVVLLTEGSILVFKYDFIGLKLSDFRRVLLHEVHTIRLGDLTYPEKSLMQPRQHGGVQIIFGNPESVSFISKWNPFTSSIPYLTFAHHPLIYHEKERETVTYNVDDFYESLLHQINQAYKAKNPGQSVKIEEQPIEIESYASVTSLIYNQSHLGFNRERGGVSY